MTLTLSPSPDRSFTLYIHLIFSSREFCVREECAKILHQRWKHEKSASEMKAKLHPCSRPLHGPECPLHPEPRKNRVFHAHLTHHEHPVPLSARQAQNFMLRAFPQPPCRRRENSIREMTYVFLTYYISFLNIFSKSSSVACFGLPGAHASAAADSQRNGRSFSLSFSSLVGIPTSMES